MFKITKCIYIENNLATNHSEGCFSKNFKRPERWTVAEIGACDKYFSSKWRLWDESALPLINFYSLFYMFVLKNIIFVCECISLFWNYSYLNFGQSGVRDTLAAKTSRYNLAARTILSIFMVILTHMFLIFIFIFSHFFTYLLIFSPWFLFQSSS